MTSAAGEWRKDLPIERQILLVVGERRGVFQIALVLRQDGLPVLEQAERRLELAAHGHQLGRGFEACRQFDRARGEAAGPAKHARFSVHDANDEIVDAVGDPAIVRQRIAGDTGKLLARLAVIYDWRRPGHVAAGHHQRHVHLLQKQEMERGRGQHEAQRVEAGRHAAGQMSRTAGAQQDDRGLRSCELALLVGTDAAVLANDVEVARHQRERLGRAALQLPQLCERRDIGRVAGQMVATDALDREDFAVTYKVGGALDVVARGMAVARRGSQRDQSCNGATPRTGDCLGVEATITRIIVFATAIRTQLERRHRGRRAIVRNRGDNAQSRSAMRTAREGIAIMAVVAVAQFGPAGRADRSVRRDLRASPAARALCDTKFGAQLTRIRPGLDRIHARQWRKVAFDTVEKGGQPRPIAADP